MLEYRVLEFKTPVHIGERGVGVEASLDIIPSTTIYGGLLNSISILYGDVIKHHPFILLSSILPVINTENGERLLLWISNLDKLLLGSVESRIEFMRENNLYIDEYNSVVEELKRVRLVDSELIETPFSEWRIVVDSVGWSRRNIRSTSVSIHVEARGRKYSLVHDAETGYGVLVHGVEKPLHILSRETRIRNIVDRVTGATTLYYLGTVKYHVKLAVVYDVCSDYREYVEPGFKLLGDIGVGGERTYGFGSYSVSGERVEAIDKLIEYIRSVSKEIGTNSFYTLVEGYYSEEEFSGRLEKSLYNGYIIYGRIGLSGFLRRPYYVVREGSIVHTSGKLVECFEIPVIGCVHRDESPGTVSYSSYSPLHIPLKTTIEV